jgi:hypothetical protein
LYVDSPASYKGIVWGPAREENKRVSNNRELSELASTFRSKSQALRLTAAEMIFPSCQERMNRVSAEYVSLAERMESLIAQEQKLAA